MAARLSEEGFTVITGGGPGIMEAANRGAQEADGVSVGLGIDLPHEQGVNPYVDLPAYFRYFFVRKTMFVKYAQAFVIFPGGFGTFDELFESLTLVQTGKIDHFPIILFGSRYWSGLLEWLRTHGGRGGARWTRRTLACCASATTSRRSRPSSANRSARWRPTAAASGPDGDPA